jgi:hypothetical protein
VKIVVNTRFSPVIAHEQTPGINRTLRYFVLTSVQRKSSIAAQVIGLKLEIPICQIVVSDPFEYQ